MTARWRFSLGALSMVSALVVPLRDGPRVRAALAHGDDAIASHGDDTIASHGDDTTAGTFPELPRVVHPLRAFAPPPLSVVVAGSLLVHRHPSATSDPPSPLPGAHLVAQLGGDVERWDFDAEISAEETLLRRDMLAHDARFVAERAEIEPDLWREAQLIPNDEGFKTQWPLALINAPKAWDTTTGDENLVVAVVDTGVIFDHPDLKPRLVGGYDFITDPLNGGDGDGRDGNPTDAGDEGEESSGFHGTHISGIIGAASGNSIGMAGVDWSCRIQPVRVLGVNRHRGKDSDIADGIRWAAGLNVPGVPQNRTPARIINMSFGGPGYSGVLQSAVLAAQARSVLLIASAGNAHADAQTNVPGALEGVVSIASAGPDGNPATYSNFGARVDFMSPGGSLFLDAPVGESTPGAVWSTSYVRATNQPVFAYAAGTSQAAAYASGVAALVRAAAPSLRPEVVAAILRRASRLPKDGCPDGCGGGLIDASLAVAYAKQISESTCGSLGCGSNKLEPAKLRPEEGCSASRRTGKSGTSASFPIVLASLAVTAWLRRRRADSIRAAFFLALIALYAGCAAGDAARDAQSTQTLTVRIKDPIPTLRDGELTISVGAGRTLLVEVTPADHVESVELTLSAPDQVIARLGHAPFALYLPKWAPGPEGRLSCVKATDAAGNEGETCFLAVP